MTLVLVAFISFFLGHFLRELKELLLTIKSKVSELYVAQKDQELKAKKMTMADPAEFNWEAMDDQEKINFLNN